jgi:sugar lactone lactonase YvrE
MQNINTHMKRYLSGIFFLAVLLTLIVTVSGCKKDNSNNTPIADPPDVVTLNMATDVSQTTAKSGGVVTYTTSTVTVVGVCYSSANQTPTTADSKTIDVATNRVWSSNLTGLTANTTYYVRAYATNGSATAYGDVVKFTTRNTPVQTATVSTIAGTTTNGFANGPGLSAMFDGPTTIAFNKVAGNIYIGDTFNNLIRTMTTAGVVGSLTNPTLGYANGSLSSALFYGPKGMAFDAAGNAYVADMGNNVIRKITPGGVVSTFAGTGVAGNLDGAGTVAMFNGPTGVAIDGAGNLYVVDKGNNMIKKITAAGVVSSIAGYSASAWIGYVDAVGANAKFSRPVAIAVDAAGTKLYVADPGNNAIRVITLADATVTTLAGRPELTDLVGEPTGLALDASGNLFVADQTGRVIEITPNNGLYTIAGSLNNAGYVNGTGTAARFNSPQGITIDAAGNIYVADFGNNTIRKITLQ